jgi:hypothetical protein
MKSKRRLFSYLLINILVSALVTVTVIYFYDRSHKVECMPVLPNNTTVTAGAGDIKVDIKGVIGAGSISNERMIIQNDGTTALELTGWSLTDANGLAYTFPQLTLFPGVDMQLHSMAGKDTPTDLYWGLSTPVWTSGELAALYDGQGIARAFYRVP